MIRNELADYFISLYTLITQSDYTLYNFPFCGCKMSGSVGQLSGQCFWLAGGGHIFDLEMALNHKKTQIKKKHHFSRQNIQRVWS